VTWRVDLPAIGTTEAWRASARRLLAAGMAPGDVVWRRGQADADLFAAEGFPDDTGRGVALRLDADALRTIANALAHRDPERFARAYDVVWRMARGGLRWADRSDRAMERLLAQAKAVARDIHKMHAFVRFREMPSDTPRRRFAAWFEPEHPIVEAAAPFFANRFGDMDWVIATPEMTALFRDGVLSFSEGPAERPPQEDVVEALWCGYYAAIFNPARLKTRAMQSEMPKKYWRNMPEAALIPALVRSAAARADAMQASLPTLPHDRSGAWTRPAADLPAADTPLAVLARQIRGCDRCPLHRCATQAVVGEGQEGAPVMIVGEQPGDAEDLAGRPFVGPSGSLLDRELDAAGLRRDGLYLTNAVKHFKFAPRGRRRIHMRPSPDEVQVCRWWLDLEQRAVQPRVIVALGATAATALTGDGNAIERRAGTVEIGRSGLQVVIAPHPAAVLRAPDPALRERLRLALRQALHTAGAAAHCWE
jgi:DNA polymerase